MKLIYTIAKLNIRYKIHTLIFCFCLLVISGSGFSQTGQTLDFDGIDDYVSLPSTLVISGNYTKEAWINPSSTTGFPNILTGTGTAFFINNGQLAAGHSTGGYNQIVDPTLPLVVGIWTHIAVTYNASTGDMKLYKDGILVQTATSVPNYIEPSLEISRFFGSNFFTGKIDEVRVWSTERTLSEIQASKDCELTGDEQGLLAYYNFNQGIAGGTNTGITTLNDDRDDCNVNNGTLVSFALTGATSNWVTPGSPVTGTCTNTFPNIKVTGNGNCIVNGDIIPSVTDFTSFGSSLFTPINRTFIIENTGTSNLTISSVIISGINASNFTVSSSPSTTISAGSSSSMTITFTPTGTQGIKNATVTINNNDADENSYTFSIDGTTLEQGKSLDFDGIDDKVDLPFVFSGSYTKEAWIKTNSFGLGGFPNILSGNPSTGTALFLNNGQLAAGHGPTFNQVIDPVSLLPDTWYHIAVTYDSITQVMQLYKNGNPVGTPATGVLSNYIETTQSIGSLSGSFYFPGKIDQVRYWSNARTSVEILNSYNCSLSGDEPGLLAWFNFTNGISEANNTGLTSLQDFSDKCNPNNGTLTGFTLNGSTSNWVADSVTLTGACSVVFPNIQVTGNNICILDGDTNPSIADNTDFGSYPLSGTNKEFVITNTGNATLNIGSISFTGPDNSMFSVQTAPSASVAAGASTSLIVHFAPTAVGLRTAAIVINNDDVDETAFTFSIQGTGLVTPLEISNVVATTDVNGNSTITWVTNLPASSIVNYGLTSGNLDSESNDATLVTNHSTVLPGLSLGTTYYFRVTSNDGVTNLTYPELVDDPLTFVMPPNITVDPATQTICEEAPVTFTSSATSDATLTVQWQISTDNAATWTDSVGATSNSINFIVSNADNGKQFRAVWTNPGGINISDTAILTVNPSTGTTSFSAGATTVCQNAADETYTASAANSTGITYSVLPVEAGVINASTGVMDWDPAFFGTATITATATGLCGTTTADRVVTVNPATGATTFSAGATTVCQNAADETYTASAANSTSITYSVLPVEAGVINASTGVMDWDPAFFGTATITATASGLCGTTTADRVVTVNPSTGTTSFSAGATTVCQNAADETYTASAANSTGVTYSVLPVEAGVINASTGVMDWDPAFSGTATITATAIGLCGTTTADRVVTVNPSTGTTSFSAGATTVCQNAADETYTASAANSTGVTYSVLPVEAGVINSTTGVMDWDPAFFGTATITATATGLCGTTTADRVVTVNPATGATTFSAGATTVCQNAADETYTASAANSTSITYAVLPVEAGVINATTGVMDWDPAFFGTATITATATGLCGSTSADRIVTVNPATGTTTFSAGATTVCQNAADETYTASAANSTGVTYSVLPVEAGVINSTTGVMDWDPAFFGTATITATASGLCGTTTADRVVTVNPSTGTTSFSAGATTVCQNAADETYTASAANSTGVSYSALPVEAGVINATTGVMDWDPAFSGTATITATATGLCGSTSADRIVTVNAATGTTTFSAGATTVCQNAADETYTASAANSTSISYAVLPVEAGVINASTGVMDWDPAFSGTATITATATGLCGTTTADRVVTVNPATGTTSFSAGATTVCQNAADETYTASAANSTGVSYSVLPVEAGVINASTGVMDWDPAFFGTATITATASGLCGSTSADRIVTVNAATGTTSFSAGATTVCQNAADETYTASAANSTGVTYSVLPVEAGVINASTGVMDWDPAFSGTATITATAIGLCGTTTADRVVTVNPATGATTFSAGATTVCQNAADETYTASAANSTSITYAVLPVEAGVINATTGVMDWDPAFFGTATITATATGLCGSTSADRIVTVNPATGTTTFSAGATTVCQNAADETYTASAANSTGVTYSVLPVEAGVINSTTGVMDWDPAFFGTATITATASGLCGTTTADRVVTVNPSTGTTSFSAGATTVCQNAADETYTASAANSTSISYAVLPVEAGVINATTGVMDWDPAFSGTATITATATGLCGSTNADRVVTVNAATGTTSFSAGATTVCQNAANETYTASAANSTGVTYSVLPVEAGVINASTGVVDWDPAFSGTATITATSTGLCGTTTADRVVTVNPSTGTTSFSAGATTVCQNAADETYTASAANSTGVSYSVLPVEAGVINASTGVMDWDPAFSGTATITATATGLCGTTTADRVVTVNPATGTTSFSAGATTVCQNAADETYTASAANSTSISYAVLPVEAGVINATTGVMDWDPAFSGTATITATSTGLCGSTNADRVVTVNAATGTTTFSAGATTVCQNAADETYTASAANSTSISYAVLPVEAGVINASTGVMDWDPAFSGTATITATSTGLCGTTTADRVVTVNPSTGTTSFSAGATTVCQNAADETYTASAANSTGVTYSVLPVEAGVINASTGVMDWDPAFFGTATITASATGLCGTTTADRVVTVNAKPNIGADITIYHNCVGETTDLVPLYNTTGFTTVEWDTPTPEAVAPGTYRLIVTNGSGCSDTAFVFVVLEVAVWTGAISDDWHTAGNWNINKVPGVQTHVIIDNTTVNECIISSANATAASVQAKASAIVKIENNREILISGTCTTLPSN